jgi:hypothetical protein
MDDFEFGDYGDGRAHCGMCVSEGGGGCEGLRPLLIVDGSGMYFNGLLWLPPGMDIKAELAAWKASKPGGTERVRSALFVAWLVERGAVEAKYETYDSWTEALD